MFRRSVPTFRLSVPASPVSFLAALLMAALPLRGAAASPPADSTSTAPARRSYETKRTATPPIIDGRVNDAAWNLVEWAGDFTEWEPDAGKRPSQQTAFKILYDSNALYIAYRAFDTEPSRIANRLARRDWFPGDWVEINIDSRHDHRTGYSFTSSVSGTRGDEFISNNGDNWDGNWDPIWDLKTQIDSLGWTAEIRIPLSQLRFSTEPDQVWGIQVSRNVFREQERSVWQPLRRGDPGWVSHFGELCGLSGLGSPRRVELFPYIVGRTERFAAVRGDPFADGSRSKAASGLDGKMGVDGNMTLDFTINPDFGQVEADPSQVNLTAFETYFAEKRPFFIEGKNIFNLPVCPAITGGSFADDNLFYSRRIGRRPSYTPELGTGEFADMPENSSILGAAKLSGKTAGGLSIGVLESATAREQADIAGPAGPRRATVEPFENYFVGRLQQDLRQGDTQLGGIVTAVHRRIDDDHLDFLNRSAWAGGFDLYHRWHGQTWYIAVNGLASRVAGRPAAMLQAQRSAAHYYQRPDITEATLDSSRTTLAGHAGSIRFGRSAGEGFRFQTGAAWRSPGFEINDLGYLRRADEINQFTWISYGVRHPFAIFRQLQLNGNQWVDWDFGGRLLVRQANANTSVQFRNNWQFYGSTTRILGDYVSNTALRGGPAMRLPAETNVNVSVNSDSRRQLQAQAGAYAAFGDHGSSRAHEVWLGPTWQPANALRVAANLDFYRSRTDLQYIATVPAGGGAQYLFGSLDQKTLSLVIRLDYTITPNLTLQYYGAPFISAGSYGDFKRITDPLAAAYGDRFARLAPGEVSFDPSTNAYSIDMDGNGAPDYTFSDFNVREFNSNLVARWEFQPGSVLYVVWSQARSGLAPSGNFSSRHDLDALFDVPPHNVLLLKVSKWFSL